MTDPNPSSPDPAPRPDDAKSPGNAKASGNAPTKPPPPKTRRWRRRLTIALVAIFGLFLLLRLSLYVALAPVLRKVAASYGLKIDYERIDLYLIDGDVGIWHVNLSDPQGNSLLQADYARCDVSTWGLLRGKLLIRRLESEGVTLQLQRKADGSIPLLAKFLQAPAAPAATSAAPSATPSPSAAPSPSAPTAGFGSLNLASPLRIDAFRLTNVHVHVIDDAVNPPLDANVQVSVRLSDLDSPQRPTRLELDVAAPPVLDLLHVEGTGRASGPNLDASLRVQVRGLHPAPASGYLRSLGIAPTARYVTMQMDAQVKTAASTTHPGALAASIALHNLAASADGQEAAALDSLSLDIDALDPAIAHISQLAIDGARVQVRRGIDGNLGIPGFELIPPRAPAQFVQSRSPDLAAVPAPAPKALVPFAPLSWSLGQLWIRNCKASLHDQSVSPAVDAAIELASLHCGTMSPDTATSPAPIDATLIAPGIIDQIRVTGSASPFASPAAIDLHIAATGIDPTALAPYLAAANLASDYSAGSAGADLHFDAAALPDGGILTDASLSNIKLVDRDELLAWKSISISGAAIGEPDGKMRVKSIQIDGPTIGAHRDAQGVMHVLGIRTQSSPAPAAAPTPPSPQAAPAPPDFGKAINALAHSLPKIQIDQFNWTGLHLALDDKALSPPRKIANSDFGVEADHLNLDLDADASSAPGEFRAWLAIPGLLDRLWSSGEISAAPGGIAISGTLEGQGITSKNLVEYFRTARVAPDLADGSLHAELSAHLRRAGDAIAADAQFSGDVSDDGVSLLGIDQASLDGLELGNGEISLGQLHLQSPRLRAWRDSDGNIRALGLIVRPAPPQAPAPTAPLLGPQVPASIATAPTISPTTAPAATQNSATLVAALHEWRVDDARIFWSDRAVRPAASANLLISAAIHDAVIGKPADPAKLDLAKFDVAVSEPSAIKSLRIAGTLQPAWDGAAVKMHFDGRGIRFGKLAGYLSSARPNLRDGVFRADLAASASRNLAGGFAASLQLADVDFRERGARRTLAGVDSVRVAASRIDPASVIAVDEISMMGLESGVILRPDGSTDMLGLSIGGPGAVQPAAPAPATRPAAKTSASRPGAVVEPSRAVALSDLAAISRKKYPLLTLATLHLNVRRLWLRDASRPGSAPLEVRDLDLWNKSPIELLGPHPNPTQEADLQLHGSIEPIVGSVNLHAQVWPLTESPGAKVDLYCSGIRGDGLTQLLPQLSGLVDGSGMTDGRFQAYLGLRLRRDRKDPLDFDLSKGFGLGVGLKMIQFQEKPDGPVLAGIDEIRADSIRVTPATANAAVKEIDIVNPNARILRDAAGIHVLGLLIHENAPPLAATQPSTRYASSRRTTSTRRGASSEPSPLTIAQSPTTNSSFSASSAPPRSISKPGGEIKIARVLISQLNVMVQDTTCSPPLVLPLNSLDVEIRDLSSSMLGSSGSPFRFQALVGAGRVPSLGHELFSQAEASGSLSLYPRPLGWVKASISALDLAALRGEAQRQGVKLDAGTFDAAAEVHFDSDGTINARTSLILTDLSLKEPAGGPIQQMFGWSFPLDVAIAAIQDADGSITIPLDLDLKSGQITGSSLTGSAALALTRVIVTAVASAPLKAVKASMLLLGQDQSKKSSQALELSFDPADTAISPSGIAQIRALVDNMRSDPTIALTLRHDLSQADVERAAILANPSPDDCRALAYRLRQKKTQLLAARDEAARNVSALLAIGAGSDAVDAQLRLRAIDRAMAGNEDALDHVLDMLRPGADRQAGRRTRFACIQIGQARLNAVRDELLSSGIPGIESRIFLTRPTYSPSAEKTPGKVIISVVYKKG